MNGEQYAVHAALHSIDLGGSLMASFGSVGGGNSSSQIANNFAKCRDVGLMASSQPDFFINAGEQYFMQCFLMVADLHEIKVHFFRH